MFLDHAAHRLCLEIAVTVLPVECHHLFDGHTAVILDVAVQLDERDAQGLAAQPPKGRLPAPRNPIRQIRWARLVTLSVAFSFSRTACWTSEFATRNKRATRSASEVHGSSSPTSHSIR